MRLLTIASVLAALATGTLEAQVSINFDGTGAPCLFVDTGPLTTLYAGQGVTFSGLGSILNQCANFLTTTARSGTGFIAYSTAAGSAETISFSSPQSFFSIFIGSTTEATVTYFLGGGAVGTSVLVLDPYAFTEETFSGSFDRVTIDVGDRYFGSLYMTLDDLTTRAGVTVATPEPASVILMATGLLGVGAVARRLRRPAV